jgi:hypothetical protein
MASKTTGDISIQMKASQICVEDIRQVGLKVLTLFFLCTPVVTMYADIL